MSARTFSLDAGVEQRLAARLYNQVLELMASDERSEMQDDEMLHAAHASRHHWGQVGEPEQWARGEWLCARVYAELGRAEPAIHHGRRCLELSEEHKLGSFDVGSAHEAIARAAKLAGLDDQAAKHAALALAQAEQLSDPEERQLLLTDITSL
jgi:tetratricopeptide (TPR) repeat protein